MNFEVIGGVANGPGLGAVSKRNVANPGLALKLNVPQLGAIAAGDCFRSFGFGGLGRFANAFGGHMQFCSPPSTELGRSEPEIPNTRPISNRSKPPECIPSPHELHFSHRLIFSRRAQIFSESTNPTSLTSSSSSGLARWASLNKPGASHLRIL